MNRNFIVLAFSIFLFFDSVYADELKGFVVGVSDGDTIKVIDSTKTEYKIRLTGIDAPEKKQPFGQKSKKSLSDLAYMKQVNIEYFKRDKYGRILGKVLVDGKDVNFEQLRLGMAWVYVKYINEIPANDQKQYLTAELTAKNTSTGLWSDNAPIPPWEYRKK